MFSFLNPFAALRRRREEKIRLRREEELRKRSRQQKTSSVFPFELIEDSEDIMDSAEEVAIVVFDAVSETENRDKADIFDGVFKNEKKEIPIEKEDIPLEVRETPIETYHHNDDSDSINRRYVPIEPSYSPESYDSPSYSSDYSSDSGSCDSGGGCGCD